MENSINDNHAQVREMTSKSSSYNYQLYSLNKSLYEKRMINTETTAIS